MVTTVNLLPARLGRGLLALRLRLPAGQAVAVGVPVLAAPRAASG